MGESSITSVTQMSQSIEGHLEAHLVGFGHRVTMDNIGPSSIVFSDSWGNIELGTEYLSRGAGDAVCESIWLNQLSLNSGKREKVHYGSAPRTHDWA